jgi:hypothetical protein
MRMSDERKASATPEGVPRRQRAAPTIDLTATEVPPPAPDASPHAATNEPPAGPPPPHEPPHVTDDLPPPPEDAGPGRRGTNGFNIAALTAGLAGGVAAAIVFSALWLSGLVPSRSGVANDADSIDALTERVTKIESTLADQPKSDNRVTERLAAAENAMKSLAVALTALNKRSDDVVANAAQARAQADAAEKAVTQLRGSVQDAAKDAAATVAPGDVEALQQRIAALEQSAKSARDDIAKAAAAETSARLAVVAAALRTAVVSGAPYSAELAQAKSLGADEKALAPLGSFAASGVPSAAALAQELRALLPQMRKASGAKAASGNFLERLEANASKLVRVQPVEAPAGDDASAVLARLDVAAARTDIAGALSDLAKLPDAARAPAQAWTAKARAREAALAAARDFAAATARTLGER